MDAYSLLRLAEDEGLRVSSRDDELVIVGHPDAEPLTLHLLARKGELLALVRLPSVPGGCDLHRVTEETFGRERRSRVASSALCACCGVVPARELRCPTYYAR